MTHWKGEKMTIQEFAEQLGQQDNPSPLLKGLQELRTYDPEDFRKPLFAGWAMWPDSPASPLRTSGEQSLDVHLTEDSQN
jgi:hypothetical protein